MGTTVAAKQVSIARLANKKRTNKQKMFSIGQLVIEFKEGGLKPEVYSYLIAMTALVKEQKELSKVLRKLKALIKDGLITDLDEESTLQIEKYQSDLIKDGVRLSVWAIHEGGSVISGLVHERLLALYTCAGCGVEAEYHIWQMKLLGKEPDMVIYDAVLAICASKNEVGAVRRLLAGVEARRILCRCYRAQELDFFMIVARLYQRRILCRCFRNYNENVRLSKSGYIKGGYYVDGDAVLDAGFFFAGAFFPPKLKPKRAWNLLPAAAEASVRRVPKKVEVVVVVAIAAAASSSERDEAAERVKSCAPAIPTLSAAPCLLLLVASFALSGDS